MQLNINEIFYSLQGEGSTTGYPFIFIRFANCNLDCSFCDTKYSLKDGKWMTIEEILLELERYHRIDKVLITGGEPLLQKEGLIDLIKELEKHHKKIYLETNGSLDISDLPTGIVKILDVKTPSSGFSESFLLSNLSYLTITDELKFIIGNKKDFDFSIDFILKHNLLDKIILLFSPIMEIIKLKDLADWIMEKRLPIKLSLQTHKIIGIK